MARTTTTRNATPIMVPEPYFALVNFQLGVPGKPYKPEGRKLGDWEQATQGAKKPEQNGQPDLDDVRDVLVRAAFAYYKLKQLPVSPARERVDLDQICVSKWRSLLKREQHQEIDVADLLKTADPTSPFWGI